MKSSLAISGRNLTFILICSSGGLALTLAGLSIGWMIGTLVMAGVLSMLNPKWVSRLHVEKGLQSYWLKAGQLMLGVQIGMQVNGSILTALNRGWLPVLIMILASIVLSLVSGMALFHFSKTDLITSLYGTTPGGLSSMIGIAADAGANMAVVSIIQTMRVILVESTVPFIVSIWNGPVQERAATAGVADKLTPASAAGLLLLIIIAVMSALLGEKIKVPAPWLLGTMLGAAAARIVFGVITASALPVWQPHVLVIAAQVTIGTCVGSRLNRKMFVDIARIAFVGLMGSIGLTAAMFLCALLVSDLTGIDQVTSILAFAPGGIDVMAVTSEALHANSTFVVAVQVLRVLAICTLLPPFFALLNRHRAQTDPASK
ncbi:AbrB family transcriptional regulator [Sporolactobacillus shoreicorticis]|uniref:AbrB family transcriptional regulator n=1 Tax=Sporolactobacillus shoreicorticis TaxID=1923877 RepID=A0ABW5S4Y8_9BACL|nr:AbrB family transcriptional regulator [Sporolactobacillus shoreicorticis]MCO7127370.1 AbrB family transcriptional regulator [Sporolactobacillus shoreicorticis]